MQNWTTFEFVNGTPDSQDGRPRYSSEVRSSTMRAFRRHQRLERQKAQRSLKSGDALDRTSINLQRKAKRQKLDVKGAQFNTPEPETVGSLVRSHCGRVVAFDEIIPPSDSRRPRGGADEDVLPHRTLPVSYIPNIEPLINVSPGLPKERHGLLLHCKTIQYLKLQLQLMKAQGMDAVSTFLLPLDSAASRNPLGLVWVHEAVHHPVLQLAICANAAQSLDSFRSMPGPSNRTLKFVTETVKSLNESLVSERAADDAIIAAIASLLGNCVC